MDQAEKNNIAYAELLNRCWEDAGYLAKFKADPAAALEEFGIPTVVGATYHVVPEDEVKPSTETDIYLPYYEKPSLTTLDDDMLDAAAGGGFMIKNSNVILNKNAVAQADVGVYSEAAVATVSVEVAYG